MSCAVTVGVDVNLLVEVHDATTGEIIAREELHNLVTDAGLALLLTSGISSVGYFACGTGATAIAGTDTTLEGEVTREAVTSTTSPTSKSRQIKYYLSSTVGNGNTIRKVGLFTAASLGTLFAAALLSSSIAKTSAIAVTFTWDIAAAAA